MSNETETQMRLRRAKETLASCREWEAQSRKELINAEAATKRAKERYEDFFAKEQVEEIARRKAIYGHTTK